MVKFIAPKVKASHYFTEYYNEMVEEFCNMAKTSGNKEIFDFVNSWTTWTYLGSDDSEDWQDCSENSEEEN